jgi:hypothetical protein
MTGKIKLSKKDFIPVVIITAIALVLSMLLTVLNFALYVSPEERTSRAMAKIYGAPVEVNAENILVDIDSDDDNKSQPIKSIYGELQKIYKVNIPFIIQLIVIPKLSRFTSFFAVTGSLPI